MSKSAARFSRQKRREDRRRPDIQAHYQPDLFDKITKPAGRARDVVISPQNPSQAEYDDAIRTARITFGIGPAGTGKTYLPCIRAAEMLKAGEIEKIYLTRPAVEAGESLGFLPGELDEKYAPYIRPIEDAFVERLGRSDFDILLKRKVIEAVPLGFLRGSTIKNSVLIADEMQNATKTQMKMLLTRIGHGARFVITGDPRQLDIPAHTSGLLDATERLLECADVRVVTFTRRDVVRDDIVAEILSAYEE